MATPEERDNSGLQMATRVLSAILGTDAPHRRYYRGWIAAALPPGFTDREATAEQIITALVGEPVEAEPEDRGAME